MNNIEAIVSQINLQIDICDIRVSKIYILQEETTEEEIEGFFADIDCLRNNTQTLQREVSKLMNQTTRSYVTYCTKSVDEVDNELKKLRKLISEKRYKDFHSNWHNIRRFYTDIELYLNVIKFLIDMQAKKVDLFKFGLLISTQKFDYHPLTEELSSLPNSYMRIRDSGAVSFDGGALLIVTMISAVANLMAIANILHNWTQKQRESHRNSDSITFQGPTHISIAFKGTEVDIENLPKSEIIDVVRELLKDKSTESKNEKDDTSVG